MQRRETVKELKGVYMDGENTTAQTFECHFCNERLTAGDVDGNNCHFVNRHVVDYVNELERRGVDEVNAHRRVIALVASIRQTAMR